MSALATARNARTAKEYSNAQTAVAEAQDGDTIEVSPGDLIFNRNCGTARSFGAACHFAIHNSITLKAQDPMKRPVMRPEYPRAGNTGGIDADGITIGAPFDLGGKKLDVSIDGFVIERLGYIYAVDSAIVLRSNRSRGWPGAVTIRDVAARDCTGGIKGTCDSLVLEDIECSDCGDGSGKEHNFYVGGELVVARRVHSFRTRTGLDGHLFKDRGRKTIIEHSLFDNRHGDASALVQIANGGELIMRATTLIQGAKTSNGKGMIWYGDEGDRNYNDETRDAWLAYWGTWIHSYDIQDCTFIDYLGNSVLMYFSAATPRRVAQIFKRNKYPTKSVPPPDTSPDNTPVDRRVRPPVTDWPAWRKALALNTLTDISPPGNTAASAYKAAGYYLPGWEGDASTDLSAWACGIIAPALGKWGGLVCGMNGHARQPASTIHHFDLDTARWVKPIRPPQIHRQVAPDYLPPPPDAECWYNTKGDLPQLTGADLVQPRTTPFSAGPYSYKYWPMKFGCRYDTNVGAAMRYDALAVIPEALGGEPAGTLVFIAPILAHTHSMSGSETVHSWRYGLSTKTHPPHSVNIMPYQARGYPSNTALSLKHKKVFASSDSYPNMGVYDPLTNAHSYIAVNSATTAYPIEGSAIITEGHTEHLYIALGSARGNGNMCFYVVDLDRAVVSAGKSWAVQNKTSTNDGGLVDQRIKVLTGVNFQQRGSLAWSRARQKLIFFQPGPNGGRAGQPLAFTLHVITVPTGATNGVPNWQTQDWVVTSPQLTLAPGVWGVYAGGVATCYKRFSYSDALDCAIYAGAPESAPVQAIKLFD